MDEEWRDIQGYEGHYQVSNLGKVRSVKREPFVLKGDLQQNGYRRVYLWLNGRKKNLLVHRLVAETFIENPDEYTDVNHLDEDKTNNHVDNLEWCTHLYNMNYGAVKKKIGDANRGRKLSEETIERLRQDTTNRRWINNGHTEKYVYFYEIDSFVENGWNVGRLKRRKNQNVRKGEPSAQRQVV